MRHRALLVGLGAIGWRWSQPGAPRSNNAANETHYHTMKHHPQIDFAGGVDVDDAARREFQQATSALVYSDLAAALTDAQPAIVTIATPPSSHADLVCQVAAFESVKGIICEKPMAESVADCRRMLDACRGKTLIIGHQRRYEQRHRLLRAFLRSDALGQIMAGVCTFPGDYLNNGTHAADILRFLVGDDKPHFLERDNDFTVRIACEHGVIRLSSYGNLEPGYMRVMYDDALDCVENGHTPECSGEDGLEAVRLALSAKEAHEQAA